MLPQLCRERMLSREDLSSGLRLLVCGFFRKLAIADILSPFVDAVYRVDSPDGSAVLIATLLFAVQIYCDFSGYSQIAVGSARLMGIRLMQNFDRPYGAKNIRDFWRRWHISLTRWFTDYVYIPLGGSRKGLPRQLLSFFVVFALCGLWHGASFSFLLWGMFHFCLMSVYTLRKRYLPGCSLGPLEQALTMGAVCFSWLFFRSGNLSRTAELLSCLFSRWHLQEGLSLLLSAPVREVSPLTLGLLLCALLLCLRRLPMTPEETNALPDAALAGLLLATLMAVLIRMDQGSAGAFIYFQF